MAGGVCDGGGEEGGRPLSREFRGEVGGEQFEGSATTGHVQLPFKKEAYSGFNNRDHAK